MEISKIRIVTDSSSDITELTDVAFSSAPLKIITAEKEYVDLPELDGENMAITLSTYNGKSSTSCPNPEDWIRAFGDAEWVFCFTITATLSGSYNSAMLAKKQYEEAHAERRVFVLNSLSTGPEMKLIADKARSLILEGKEFDCIASELEQYSQKTGLLFMLESLKNLANNGRVSRIVASMAGLLGIRLVGKASDKGDLQPLNKCRGERNALEAIVKHLIDAGVSCGRVLIGHCMGENAANGLKELINKRIPNATVEIYKCRGLCSFYAEKGGILVGFEKF